MGFLFSKPTQESPSMEAIKERHRAEELEREKARLEAQLKAKEHTDQMNASLSEKVDQVTKALRLMEGRIRDVRPTQWPTPQQFDNMKRQYDYSPDKFHIAISGQSGTGKSSIINSLRGLYPEDEQAAATGDVECTQTVTRYPDVDPRKNLVWFDVPGAGTQSHPEAEYFNDKGLYIFDAILVIVGDRFGSTDIAILRQCALYKIPCYIVRSKADVHVRNRYDKAWNAERRKRRKEKGRELSNDEAARLFEREKLAFENVIRQSVDKELVLAALPPQPVFIVSSEGLLSVIRGNMSKISNEIMVMENEGVENKSKMDGRGEVEDEDSDGDGDEEAPYVVFDEERLLADITHTSYLARVARDSRRFVSKTDSLTTKFAKLQLMGLNKRLFSGGVSNISKR